MTSGFNISVIVPTFNRRHTIERALRSILSQSFAAYQVIVVDDGSDDDTAAFIQTRFKTVEYIYQKNAGVSSARNRGIKAARGEWIAFLDSDDEWRQKKLETQIKALIAQPDNRFCHTEEIWVRNGIRVNAMKKHAKSGGYIFRQCLPMCVISPSSVLMHRQVIDDIGLFDETLPACEDYDYWLRFCARYSVLYIDEPLLVKYGGHDDQLSRRYWGMDRFRIQALENVIKSGVLGVEDHEAAMAMIARKCRILNRGALKYGNIECLAYCERVKRDLLLQMS
ncbi:MAG: glycosyltransferase family 2 protein [Gammaproteobacteria bacterium]|nr:glycosyltransferase family 2 protein [Gammaproteobacteria bacterium]